ncbi:MAG: molybdopterin molybdenumtransferase MoeA [Caulobacteraceae bacterium]|nr:molybdopterin molybdenumtransferase MoeA [Caulobacteraceae bacterium]
MLSGLTPLGIDEVPLAGALGRFLARPVLAARDQPPFAASAMDGWAVRAVDGEGPRRIVGESAAGHGYAGEVGPGEAVRIFTGAALPAGADAVVIQEDARREGDQVFIPAVAHPRHIRSAGLDFRAGDRLLEAGVRLDPWRLSLAAAAGVATPAVFARPRLAILSTGEEVVEPGGKPGPFQIFNSGSTALTALAETWGAQAVPLPPVGDDEAATARAVAEAGGDLVVTLGGASVGDHDLVKPALARLGLSLVVESVAVRPGKPTWFGTLGDGRRVLGLPGNPASALVCAELFLRPILRALQGARPGPFTVSARAEEPLPANGDREHWLRARLTRGPDGVLWAKPLRDQDSSLVTIFAEADALIRRARRAPDLAAGEALEALILDRLS